MRLPFWSRIPPPENKLNQLSGESTAELSTEGSLPQNKKMYFDYKCVSEVIWVKTLKQMDFILTKTLLWRGDKCYFTPSPSLNYLDRKIFTFTFPWAVSVGGRRQSGASIQVTWSLPANQRRAVCWWQEPVAVSGPSGCFLQFLFSIFFLFSKCLPGIFWSIFFQDNSPRNCKDFYENIFVIIKATVFPLVSQSFCLIMVSLV